MTAIDSTGRSTQWGVGTAIGTSAAILLGHLGPFVGTALLASLPSLLFAVVAPASRWQILVDLVVAQIVAVTLIYGTVQALRGRQVSMSECISQGFARLGTAIGVAILVGIGVALGMVLLIVPGLIIAMMWAVAIPAAVVERTGVVASLSRSVFLTRERRWRVFGAVLVETVIMFLVGIVIGAIAGFIGGTETVLYTIAVWVLTAVSQAFSASVSATLYYFLRREKEGVDIDQIAAVFD